VGFQLFPFAVLEALPAYIFLDDGFLVQLVDLLVGHLEEEQVGELFHVIAIGDAVVPEDVAVVPQALDDGC